MTTLLAPDCMSAYRRDGLHLDRKFGPPTKVSLKGREDGIPYHTQNPIALR